MGLVASEMVSPCREDMIVAGGREGKLDCDVYLEYINSGGSLAMYTLRLLSMTLPLSLTWNSRVAFVQRYLRRQHSTRAHIKLTAE